MENEKKMINFAQKPCVNTGIKLLINHLNRKWDIINWIL